VASGRRRGKVPLDRVRFELARPELVEAEDPDQADVAATYATCYRQVFGKPGDRLRLEAARRLGAVARREGVTLRLYLFAAMLAFRDANPDRRCYANHLLGPAASRHVSLYRRTAAQRFGVFDLTALLTMTGPIEDASQALELSEGLAALWIVGHRLHHGKGAVASLYAARELALDPRWLATEPTYKRWLSSGEAGATDELLRHRHRVSQAGVAWTVERERVLPKVLARVLWRYEIRLVDLEAESPVRQPLAFWAALGDALLQRACLRFLDGGETAFGEGGLPQAPLMRVTH
jgi:hypothetical protein